MKLKIITILIIVLALAFTAWQFYHLFKKTPVDQNNTEERVLAPSINGSMVEVSKTKLRPVAVVIENHSDSRPQSGLTDADIVYETLAEGGITRFLAIFQTREPKAIGPVRSARPYFNFLADLWHAPLVHSGGSKRALSELSAGIYEHLFDVNEFYYGTYFTRSSERTAPHNLFTTLTDIRKLLESKNQTKWDPVKMWDTQSTPTDQLKTDVTKITVPFSPGSYSAKFEYDPNTNTYKRFTGSTELLDKNNLSIVSPKNVMILLTDIAPFPDDDLGTQKITLNSSGPCYLFHAGIFVQCKWQYQNEVHNFINLDGSPLKLDPGQTWIAIFPRDRQNEVKWE